MKFKKRFETYSNERLVELLNFQVESQGFADTRVNSLAAPQDTLLERGLDISAIGNEEELSFSKRVKLVGNKIVPAE